MDSDLTLVGVISKDAQVGLAALERRLVLSYFREGEKLNVLKPLFKLV